MQQQLFSQFCEISLILKHHSSSHRAVMNIESLSYFCKRLPSVEGDQGKLNDVVVCRKLPLHQVKEHVFFFGGDVQDYSENMESHRDNHRYIQWNLESTARIIARRFPNSLVMIVKPKEMFLRTFSVYSNFLKFSDTGIPELNPENNSLKHLYKLHNNVVKKLAETESYKIEGAGVVTKSADECRLEKETPKEGLVNEKGAIKKDSLPLRLVGFSKGCVVLNQILFELETDDIEEKEFLSQIHAMYWLDGGHNGSQDTWITDDILLRKLSSYPWELYSYVTPYQVDDPMRAWIGKEHNMFVSKINKFGGKLRNVHLFMDQPASIENHFDVLNHFAT